jgi:deazaflavin-dependent oxidoreductase (nitroreductase family)
MPRTSTESTKDAITRFWTGVHQMAFRASNGLIGGWLGTMPVVMLTTKGRKTGQPRTTMLTSPFQDGEKVVLIASYGGDRQHPTWYLNLRENPDVEITMLGTTRKMRARTATKTEKAEIWPRVTSRYGGYAQYQQSTTRDIPVVILEPPGSAPKRSASASTARRRTTTKRRRSTASRSRKSSE